MACRRLNDCGGGTGRPAAHRAGRIWWHIGNKTCTPKPSIVRIDGSNGILEIAVSAATAVSETCPDTPRSIAGVLIRNVVAASYDTFFEGIRMHSREVITRIVSSAIDFVNSSLRIRISISAPSVRRGRKASRDRACGDDSRTLRIGACDSRKTYRCGDLR